MYFKNKFFLVIFLSSFVLITPSLSSQAKEMEIAIEILDVTSIERTWDYYTLEIQK